MAGPGKKSAVGLLRLLLVASVAVPTLLFIATSWRDYRQQFIDAQRDLDRTSEVARENAVRVFERQRDVADSISDVVWDMDARDVLAAEFSLHQQLATLVSHTPEIQGAVLVGANGEPLVSTGIYPAPHEITFKSRDYFRAVMSGGSGTFISRLQVGEIIKQMFFGFARPWTGAGGKIKGVIEIAISPRFFEDVYALLMNEEAVPGHGKVLTLMRSDGQILVRYPPAPEPPPRIPPGSPFFGAVASHPDGGIFEAKAGINGKPIQHIFAYRRVDGFPLYVLAGRSVGSILADWWQTILGRLAIGVPGTLALFLITRTALVRTRREEEALAQADAEIAKRERAEQALLRAQRLEAVGQLTGGVAHDFNNLLTVIIGSIELLERRPDDVAAVRRLARNIRSASERGAEITAKLLSFSRQHRVNPETVDVNARLRAFEPLLRQAVPEGIAIAFDLEADVFAVTIDPGEFEAAILNLVGNARDAMPQGGHITIATRNDLIGSDHAEMQPGPAVRIIVSDEGIGMDAETAAKAIEPFFTTKGVGRGTGLGLSQVYGFAKQSGGDLRIETAPGQGTAIEIILPGAAASAGLTAPRTAPSRRGAEGGEVVLVVEDEPPVREVVVEGLHALGYETLSASDADSALAILRGEGRIDLLFSDVVMPGGSRNGAGLYDEARRLRPGLKVLLTSGYHTGLEPMPAGVAVLSKPYDHARLAEQVREVLARED